MLVGAGEKSLVPGDDQMRMAALQFIRAKTLAVEQAVAMVRSVLAPWTAGCYANFAETSRAGNEVFFDSYERLRRVKWAYDPTDVFGDLADALAEAFPSIAPEVAAFDADADAEREADGDEDDDDEDVTEDDAAAAAADVADDADGTEPEGDARR